jgi:hypothetical protein
MSNLIGASSCSFSNSLPANLTSRVGFRDKSLRNARMASTTPNSNFIKLCYFFKLHNISFSVCVSVSSITVELFLLGGPNWFETKPIDAEKLAIRKLYNASRKIKLDLNLNALETACAMRR